jgi:hypothetical protein
MMDVKEENNFESINQDETSPMINKEENKFEYSSFKPFENTPKRRDSG